MRGWRRSAALAGIGALLIAAAGCAPKVASTGQRLADPSQPLETALTKLKKDNDAGIQNNSITVSSATECFYEKPNNHAKGISNQAVCWPIRRLGLPADRVWDRYQLSFGSDSNGDAVATVGNHTAQGVAVDTGLLVSPAGDKPSDAADLPAPRAPQTAVADRAVAVADSATPAGLTFTPPSHPVRLITPTAMITVTGSAPVKTVPNALVAGQHDPAGKAPYYLPASGQTLYAYRLRISAAPKVPAATGSATSAARTLGTTLGLRAGTASIAISDQTGSGVATPDLTIPCPGSGADAYPCRVRTSKITVLMSVPTKSALSLSATTAGSQQVVDLGTGAVDSKVSTVDYDRSSLTTKIDKTLRSGPYQVRLVPSTTPSAHPTPAVDPKDHSDDHKKKPSRTIAATAHWSIKINSLALTAYDPGLGWAPKDRAWLIMCTSGYHRTEHGAVFDDHRAESLALNIGNVGHPVRVPSDDDLAGQTGSAVNWAFAVPADTTTATVSFRPTGTVSADGVSASFTSDRVATLQVDVAK